MFCCAYIPSRVRQGQGQRLGQKRATERVLQARYRSWSFCVGAYYYAAYAARAPPATSRACRPVQPAEAALSRSTATQQFRRVLLLTEAVLQSRPGSARLGLGA